MSIFPKKTLNKALSVLIALVILVSALSCSLVTSAASFSGGSGTKKDPYLLKTAKDVDAIRNNLSAHYKLAATIDMSSLGTFEPIAAPIEAKEEGNMFTGSLTCDLGDDGLPRYAILNLKVNNTTGTDYGYDFGSANYAGYGEEGVHYSASLFGKTKGATFKNIVLLNVDITNTVIGQNAGVGGYSDPYGRGYTIIRPMVDDQGAAGLVTRAYGTTITGCGVQGKLKSSTNNFGGIVANLWAGSTITNSWVDVNIESSGMWGCASFVGTMNASTIKSCYAKGTLNVVDVAPKYASKPGWISGGSVASGFVRTISADSTISDCYCEVNCKGPVSGGFTTASCEGEVKNCYYNGKDEGTAAAASDTKLKISNCWSTSASKEGFTVGSIDQIKAALTGKAWDNSGATPTLAKIKYITDYSIYVAGQERQGAGAPPASASGGSDADGETAEGETSADGGEAAANGDVSELGGFEASTSYIILFVCFAAITIAISACSVVTLLRAIKQSAAVADNIDDEYDDESEVEE